MPVDPMTGQMIPYGSGAQDTPLAMRLMEDMPGMAAAVGFGSNRGSNTILRGGFMDDSGILAGRRADRYRVFSGGAQPSVSPINILVLRQEGKEWLQLVGRIFSEVLE